MVILVLHPEARSRLSATFLLVTDTTQPATLTNGKVRVIGQGQTDRRQNGRDTEVALKAGKTSK